MYEKFYGFREKPFHIVPNSNTLFLTDKHQAALTYLEYGLIEAVGFILLTGEIGTGKTTLIRYMLKKMDQGIEVAVIFNTNVTAEQLLNLVLSEYELAPAKEKAEGLDRLNQFLIEKYSQGKRVLLIIDEAQNLSDEALEEVRMLSNLQTDDQLLLQIMLVGQPQLKRRLQDPRLTQLAQRIAVNYHLAPLTREESIRYMAFRLERVGGRLELFDDDAQNLIYQAAGGIPRTINLLCDSALVYGFADELQTIDKHLVEQVLQDKGEIGLGPADTPQQQSTTEPSQAVADTAARSRLENIEDEVRKLKIQVEWHIGEMERRSDGYKDELVHKFKELLFQERKLNGKLIAEITRLKERVQNSQKQQGLSSSQEPFPWEEMNMDDGRGKSRAKQGFFSWLKT
jgi:general secretion pathway protein A